jgi:hypothetical protein
MRWLPDWMLDTEAIDFHHTESTEAREARGKEIVFFSVVNFILNKEPRT